MLKDDTDVVQPGSKSCMLIKGNSLSKKDRPERFCIYYKPVVNGGKLKRHIKRNHKAEVDVHEAMAMPSCLQNQFFETKRLEGIYQYNLIQISKHDHKHNNLMNEKRSKNSNELRMCCIVSDFCQRDRSTSTSRNVPV